MALGVKCPQCGSSELLFSEGQQHYMCEECGHTFRGGAAPTLRRIFLSYGHDEHAELALRLKEDLQARGHQVWFDLDRLKPGGDFEAYIEDGINWASGVPGAGRVVLLITPHSVRRPDGYCLNEIARALERRMDVVPVMVVWAEPPLSICRIQWLDMQDCVPVGERAARYEVKFERLADALEQGRASFGGAQARLAALLQLEQRPFEAEILEHLPRFTGRRWVFDRIDAWLADPDASRVFWIVGDPGMGKTAIAAWLCYHRREIAAFHLCRHGHTQKSDPRRCVMSIAYQLSSQLPDYQERLNALDLERLVAESNAATLFDALIVQPLWGRFPEPDRLILVLVDGLDEATEAGRNELAAFIASEFHRTPEWMRLVVTSRPDPQVLHPLQRYTPYVLCASASGNEQDIRDYLVRELRPFVGETGVPPPALDALLDRSEGVFLYAKWAREELLEGRLSLGRLDEFPQGLGGVYAQFFGRQFGDLEAYESKVRPALELLSAAQEPLGQQALASALGWDDYDTEAFRRSVGSLFPTVDGVVRPFHTSVMEWLTNPSTASDHFVSVKKGHQLLAEQAWQEYQRDIATVSRYTLAHLVTHLLAVRELARAGRALSDPPFVRKKCESGMVQGLIADIFAAQCAGVPAEPMWSCLVSVAEARDSDSFRRELRRALNACFGPEVTWPEELREVFMRSCHPVIQLFLGETYDMEGRYREAEQVFRRMREGTRGTDERMYATASVRLSVVLDHMRRYRESLEVLDELVSVPGFDGRFPGQYWWAEYHRGICLGRLKDYASARKVLSHVQRQKHIGGLSLSALHQLGVVDVEDKKLRRAERTFTSCLQRRGSDERDFRRAYEHRRLGQVYARTERFEEAREAFRESIAISLFCAHWRYVAATLADMMDFLDAGETPSLCWLEEASGLDQQQLLYALRVLRAQEQGYLDVIDPGSARPTGRIARWDVVHRKGHWHHSVMVLIGDSHRRVALQERGEPDSKGRWDVSVAGHQDVGETDEDAALREMEEELGLVVLPERLVRVGSPYRFRKYGGPRITRDRHDGRYCYRYRRPSLNRERQSVFVVVVADEEMARVIARPQTGALSVRWLPLSEAASWAEREPAQFASAFKQLLHPAILRKIEAGMG